MKRYEKELDGVGAALLVAVIGLALASPVLVPGLLVALIVVLLTGGC